MNKCRELNILNVVNIQCIQCRNRSISSVDDVAKLLTKTGILCFFQQGNNVSALYKMLYKQNDGFRPTKCTFFKYVGGQQFLEYNICL